MNNKAVFQKTLLSMAIVAAMAAQSGVAWGACDGVVVAGNVIIGANDNCSNPVSVQGYGDFKVEKVQVEKGGQIKTDAEKPALNIEVMNENVGSIINDGVIMGRSGVDITLKGTGGVESIVNTGEVISKARVLRFFNDGNPKYARGHGFVVFKRVMNPKPDETDVQRLSVAKVGSFTNSGRITARDGSGVLIVTRVKSFSNTKNALIATDSISGDGKAVMLETSDSTITNNGTILSTPFADAADGLDIDRNAGNYQQITDDKVSKGATLWKHKDTDDYVMAFDHKGDQDGFIFARSGAARKTIVEGLNKVLGMNPDGLPGKPSGEDKATLEPFDVVAWGRMLFHENDQLSERRTKSVYQNGEWVTGNAGSPALVVVGDGNKITNTGTIQSNSSFGVLIDGYNNTVKNNGIIAGGKFNESFNEDGRPNYLRGAISAIGSGNRLLLTGGSVLGDVAGMHTIDVTGSVFLDGHIFSQWMDQSGNRGPYFGKSMLNVAADAALALGKDTVIEGDLNLKGRLIVPLNDNNRLVNEEAKAAAVTLAYLESPQKSTATVGNNVDTEAYNATLDEASEIRLRPSVQGGFTFGTTGTYQVLKIDNDGGDGADDSGINGRAAVTSGSFLMDVVDSQYDRNTLKATVKTNNLAAAVNPENNPNVTAVASALQNAMAGLDKETAERIMDRLLKTETLDDFLDLLKKEVPGLDPEFLEAAQAAAGGIQSGVFSNILSYLASMRDGGRSGIGTGDLLKSGGMWFKVIASQADQQKQRDKGIHYNGYRSRLRGFTIGGDVDVNDQLTIGTSLSYATADVNVKKAAANSDVRSYQVSLYSNWQHQDWFVDTIINLGINDTVAKSRNGSVTTKANFDSMQYGLQAVVGKEFWFNNKDTLVEPQLSLKYSLLDTDTYTRKSSNGAAVKVKPADFKVMELGAGGRVSQLLELDNGVLLPEASFMVYHDLEGDRAKQKVNARLLGTPLAFRTQGVTPERTSYKAGVGVAYWMDNNVSLSFNYDHKWHSGFKSDNIKAKIRYDF